MDAESGRTVKALLTEVRARVERRTFVQDVLEAKSGRVDERKVAAKFNNLEHAVEDLADAMERIVAAEDRETA